MTVKVPLTWDGLKACQALTRDGIMVNVTLCFSAGQALLAAKAGATFVSPFVGRLDDAGQDGMELLREIRTVYDNYADLKSHILAASIRHVGHVKEAAMIGADVATVPISADVLAYAVDLARGTRLSPSVKLGVSPRGTTALVAAARAWAWLTGAEGVTPDHIQAMAIPVLRHRIQLRPEAELEGVAADAVLRSIMQQVQVPI